MRDATEYMNSIGYALFAVIKAIFSNPNALEMIMNYIYNSPVENQNDLELDFKVFFFVDS